MLFLVVPSLLYCVFVVRPVYTRAMTHVCGVGTVLDAAVASFLSHTVVWYPFVAKQQQKQQQQQHAVGSLSSTTTTFSAVRFVDLFYGFSIILSHAIATKRRHERRAV